MKQEDRCRGECELESFSVVSNHVAFTVNEVDVVVIGGDLEVLGEELAELGGNTGVDFRAETSQTHDINLSAGNVIASPEHYLSRNHADGHISTELDIFK